MSDRYPDLDFTTYPNKIDDISRFLNATASDAAAIAQMQSYLAEGDMAKAYNVMTTIPSYAQKFPNAASLNRLRDAIIALERLYQSEEMQDYIGERQLEWENIISQLAYKGIYNQTQQYAAWNIVSYTANGETELYIVLPEAGYSSPPTGTNVTDTRYFRKLTIRGKRGASGEGVSFCGTWTQTDSYSTNDVVALDNAWYIALENNTGKEPSQFPAVWERMFQVTPPVYPEGYSEPAGLTEGDYWLKILE